MSFEWMIAQSLIIGIFLLLGVFFELTNGRSRIELFHYLVAWSVGFFTIWLTSTVAGLLNADLIGKVLSFLVGCIVCSIIVALVKVKALIADITGISFRLSDISTRYTPGKYSVEGHWRTSINGITHWVRPHRRNNPDSHTRYYYNQPNNKPKDPLYFCSGTRWFWKPYNEAVFPKHFCQKGIIEPVSNRNFNRRLKKEHLYPQEIYP